MALQRYEQATSGDNFKTEENLNVPCLVQPLEKKTGIKTQYDPDGEKIALICNVYDLEQDVVYGRAILFNGALVDQLGRYLGQETVVRFVNKKTRDGKATYRGVDEGTEADYKMAEAKLDAINEAIAARLVELDSGSSTPTPSGQDPAQAAKVSAAFKR